MKWVTWENVGVDRMACAWLIMRFIDSEAEFVFVSPGMKPPSNEGQPFDIPGVRLSHHRGHCSFHAFLREYDLKDPALHRIAQIVDEADTVQDVCLEPAAFGLDMICRGLRITAGGDDIALERGTLIYDALYAHITSSMD